MGLVQVRRYHFSLILFFCCVCFFLLLLIFFVYLSFVGTCSDGNPTPDHGEVIFDGSSKKLLPKRPGSYAFAYIMHVPELDRTFQRHYTDTAVRAPFTVSGPTISIRPDSVPERGVALPLLSAAEGAAALVVDVLTSPLRSTSDAICMYKEHARDDDQAIEAIAVPPPVKARKPGLLWGSSPVPLKDGATEGPKGETSVSIPLSRIPRSEGAWELRYLIDGVQCGNNVRLRISKVRFVISFVCALFFCLFAHILFCCSPPHLEGDEPCERERERLSNLAQRVPRPPQRRACGLSTRATFGPGAVSQGRRQGRRVRR